jgi:K+-sensing histidine kinase KdpD
MTFSVKWIIASLHENKNDFILLVKECPMSPKKFQPNLQSQLTHELRIPLSAILGYVSFLEDTQLTNEQTAYIHDIEESANRLLIAQGKINQLVTASIARS